MSYAAVSKFINKKKYVSEITGLKIEKAIEKLGYRPDFAARSLVNRSSNFIGLVIRDITNAYYGEMIKGVEEYIDQNGKKYSLLLSNISNMADSIAPYIEPLLSHKVAGILTTSENIGKEYVDYLKKIDIPIVFIGCYKKDENFDFSYVTMDDYKGAFNITQHLIKNGHRNICFICSIFDSSFSIDRLEGFKAAMKANGIIVNKESVLFCENIRIEDGFICAQRIFGRKNKPSAILCINDEVSYGVMDYCCKNNIKIPKDLSVAGFDDDVYSSLSFINLTTVKDPVRKIGYTAAEMLFDEITNNNKERIIKVVEPEIIIRNSTGTF